MVDKSVRRHRHRSGSPGNAKSLASASILLIEDSKFVQKMVVRLLKEMPVGRILITPSAEDALYNLEKDNDIADVLILDYGLRGMNGLRFLRKLRRHDSEKLRSLAVVVLTAKAKMKIYQDMACQGIAAFLGKPVGGEMLRAALERALEGYRIPNPLTTTPEFMSHLKRKVPTMSGDPTKRYFSRADKINSTDESNIGTTGSEESGVQKQKPKSSKIDIST